MKANKIFNLQTAVTLLVPVFLVACGGSSDDGDNTPEVFERPTSFSNFPVTLTGVEGEDSVSYAGQMARHTLRESLKSAITSDDYSKDLAMKYFANADSVVDGDAILAPANADEFTFKEATYGEISSSRRLSDKLFDVEGSGDPISGGNAQGKVMGFPGNLSPQEFVEWMLEQRETAGSNTDTTTGYNFQQIVAKYLMGAVFYNQTVDKYLDENLAADVKPNDEPYSDGSSYTGKEHSWDEGFGYFGAAAHYGELTASENYSVNKKSGAEALALADKDGDGVVSMYTEYNYAAAYYAASFDRDGNSTYGADIMDAFLEGRTLIANAVDDNGVARALTDDERTELMTFATTIQNNWEKVFAEAVYKYAGSSYNDIADLLAGTETDPADYYKHWGELKGFMLSLQYGGANSIIDNANFNEIDGLVGYSPVLVNGDQVNGLDASNAVTFSTGNSLADYQANLKAVQEKLDAKYGLKAKQNTID